MARFFLSIRFLWMKWLGWLYQVSLSIKWTTFWVYYGHVLKEMTEIRLHVSSANETAILYKYIIHNLFLYTVCGHLWQVQQNCTFKIHDVTYASYVTTLYIQHFPFSKSWWNNIWKIQNNHLCAQISENWILHSFVFQYRKCYEVCFIMHYKGILRHYNESIMAFNNRNNNYSCLCL